MPRSGSTGRISGISTLAEILFNVETSSHPWAFSDIRLGYTLWERTFVAAQFVPPLLSTDSRFTVVYGYKADKIISVRSNVSMVGGAALAARKFWANIDFEKLFSADEANELIPRLEVLVRDLQVQAGSDAQTHRRPVAFDDKARLDAPIQSDRTLSRASPAGHADERNRQRNPGAGLLPERYRSGTGRFPFPRSRPTATMRTTWSSYAGNTASRASSHGIAIESPASASAAPSRRASKPCSTDAIATPPSSAPWPMIVLIFIYLLALVCWLGSDNFLLVHHGRWFSRCSRVPMRAKSSAHLSRATISSAMSPGSCQLLSRSISWSRSGRARGWWLASVLTIWHRARMHPLCGNRRPPARRRDSHRLRRRPIPTPRRKAEFDHLHHLSVMLNGAVSPARSDCAVRHRGRPRPSWLSTRQR